MTSSKRSVQELSSIERQFLLQSALLEINKQQIRGNEQIKISNLILSKISTQTTFHIILIFYFEAQNGTNLKKNRIIK